MTSAGVTESRYRKILEWSPDDGGHWIVEVPDLPGCISDGATQTEALTNVEDAIRLWLEVDAERNGEVARLRGVLREIAESGDDRGWELARIARDAIGCSGMIQGTSYVCGEGGQRCANCAKDVTP